METQVYLCVSMSLTCTTLIRKDMRGVLCFFFFLSMYEKVFKSISTVQRKIEW